MRGGEQLADVVEHARVGGCVRARGTANGRLVHVDDLVEQLDAQHRRMPAGCLLRLVDLLHERRQQDVANQRALARARHARDRHETSERNTHIDVLQVVFASALYGEPVVARGTPFLRHWDAALAREVLAGDGLFGLEDALDRPAIDHCPTVLAGTGTNIDDPVAGANGVFVVLDHQHRVAQISEPHKRLDEAMVVSLVQANGRLIEHVQRAHKTGADLAGKANALRFSTSKGARRARQRQIVEADIEQETEAGVDLFHDALGNHAISLAELEAHQELCGLADAHIAHFGDVLVVDRDGQAGRLQSSAATCGTRHEAHVALVLLAAPVALGSLMAALDPRDDTFVGSGIGAGTAVAILVFHGHVAIDAMQHDLHLLGVHRAPRRIDVDLVDIGDRFDHAIEVLRVRRTPRSDCTAGNRQVRVGHDEVGVDLKGGAKAVARRACAIGRVKREVTRGELFETGAAVRTGQVLAERERVLGLAVFANDLDFGHAIGQLERGFEAVGESTLDALAAHETVDDYLDGVVFVTRQALIAFEELDDVDEFGIDTRTHVSLPSKVFEQRLVLAFAPAHHRSQHLKASALRHQQDAIDDLLRGLALQAGAVGGAMLNADARVEQAQIVVDLGDGADG